MSQRNLARHGSDSRVVHVLVRPPSIQGFREPRRFLRVAEAIALPKATRNYALVCLREDERARRAPQPCHPP